MERPLATTLCLALLGVLPLPVLRGCGGQAGGERPGVAPRHLVLVTVAGLGAERSSAYLYGRATTDFEIDGHGHEQGRNLTIDDLVDAGVLFQQAFTPATSLPGALASLLLGASPLDLDAEGNPPAGTSLAESFAARGFRCAGFVNHGGQELAPEWFRGFHEFRQADSDMQALAPAVTFLAEQDWGNQQGVFLWVHLASPLEPFEPPRMSHNYRGGEVDYATLFPALDGDERGALYDGELAYTNYLIWHLLDLLRYFGETEGVLADTAICLAGTSGMELNRPESLAPGTTDAALRVPLLLRHPRSMTGRRVLADAVSLRDVPSTLADWFGLGDLGGGRSLLGLTDVHASGTFAAKPVCSLSTDGRSASVRGEAWRMVIAMEDLTAPNAAELAQWIPVATVGRLPSAPSSEEQAQLLQRLRAWTAASGGAGL